VKVSKSNKSSGNWVSPTLLPGGGRDWSIDTERQIITSKHHPNLALGSLLEDPLILTHRYSYDNPYDNDNDGNDFNLVKFSKKD